MHLTTSKVRQRHSLAGDHFDLVSGESLELANLSLPSARSNPNHDLRMRCPTFACQYGPHRSIRLLFFSDGLCQRTPLEIVAWYGLHAVLQWRLWPDMDWLFNYFLTPSRPLSTVSQISRPVKDVSFCSTPRRGSLVPVRYKSGHLVVSPNYNSELTY